MVEVFTFLIGFYVLVTFYILIYGLFLCGLHSWKERFDLLVRSIFWPFFIKYEDNIW